MAQHRAPVAWVFDGVIRAKLEDTLRDGIMAWVTLYYRNFTDAVKIEPDAIVALSDFLDGGYIYPGDVDLMDVVREAELLLNESGGVVSDTTGERHTVCTYPEDD